MGTRAVVVKLLEELAYAEDITTINIKAGELWQEMETRRAMPRLVSMALVGVLAATLLMGVLNISSHGPAWYAGHELREAFTT